MYMKFSLKLWQGSTVCTMLSLSLQVHLTALVMADSSLVAMVTALPCAGCVMEMMTVGMEVMKLSL